MLKYSSYRVKSSPFLSVLFAIFSVVFAAETMGNLPDSREDSTTNLVPRGAPAIDPQEVPDDAPTIAPTAPLPANPVKSLVGKTAGQKKPSPVGAGRVVPDPSPLVADPPSLDLGFLAPNVAGAGKVVLRNTGDKTLTITHVQPSCKCTTPSNLVGTQIPPGGTADLEIKLDGASAMGARNSAVKVMVEGYARALDVSIKAEVSLPIRIVPPYINAIEKKNLTGKIILESIDRKPFRILSSSGAPISIEGFDPAVDAPRNSYIVGYDLTATTAQQPGFIYFETDAPDAGVVDVRIRSDKPPKKSALAVADGRCNVGLIAAGTSKEAVFTLANPTVELESVATTSPDAIVALVRTEVVKDVGRKVYVTVTPREGFSGILLLPVTLKSPALSGEVLIVASVRPAAAPVQP